MLLLLALEGLDLAPARHARGVDGVQRAVAERREVVRQAALLDLLVDRVLEVRQRLLPKTCARVTVEVKNLAGAPPADRWSTGRRRGLAVKPPRAASTRGGVGRIMRLTRSAAGYLDSGTGPLILAL